MGAATQTFAPGGKHPRAATDFACCACAKRGLSRIPCMVLISINVLFTLIIGSAINPIWVLQTMHTEDVNINQHQLVDELAYALCDKTFGAIPCNFDVAYLTYDVPNYENSMQLA